MSEEYIIYISGGYLGDFFHQLSIINELWIKTGKKGILYISELHQNFRKSIEETFTETYDIVTIQNYIHEYKIYNGEYYDINLSQWRNNLHTNTTLIDAFQINYDIFFGKNKWLNHIQFDKIWQEKIVINTTHYRFIYDLNIELLRNNENIVYVSYIESEYIFFKDQTGIEIDYYCPQSLMELCIIINSCKRFIGSLSAPLSIATALHKDCVYGGKQGEHNFFDDFDKELPFISYSI